MCERYIIRLLLLGFALNSVFVLASNPFSSPPNSGLYNVDGCDFDWSDYNYIASFQSSYATPSNAPYSCFSFCYQGFCGSTQITNNAGTVYVNVLEDTNGCSAAIAIGSHSGTNDVNWPSPMWGQTPDSPYAPGMQNLNGEPCIVEIDSEPCYWQYTYLLANNNPTQFSTPDWYPCAVMEPVKGPAVWPSVVGSVSIPPETTGCSK